MRFQWNGIISFHLRCAFELKGANSIAVFSCAPSECIKMSITFAYHRWSITSVHFRGHLLDSIGTSYLLVSPSYAYIASSAIKLRLENTALQFCWNFISLICWKCIMELFPLTFLSLWWIVSSSSVRARNYWHFSWYFCELRFYALLYYISFFSRVEKSRE